MVSIEAYGGWDSKVMILYHFRHIRSAYNPEFGESTVGGKCHQLLFLIQFINRASAITFVLVPNAAFDEGGIATHSRFFCVYKYNKYNQEKIRIDFFVLFNRNYYFIFHISV